MTYKYHEFASVFPLMKGAKLKSLAKTIKEDGLNCPITLFEGKVLDGRNRLRACVSVGVEPRFIEFKGTRREALTFVWNENEERRQLSPSEEAACKVEYEAIAVEFKAEAKARQVEGGKTAGRGRPKKKVGQLIDQPIKRDNSKRTDAKLASSTTNRTYIAACRKLKKEDPKAFKQIKSGEKTVPQVQREKKEQKREKRREENRAKVAQVADPVATDAKFATIVIDPPWHWGDEGDCDQLGRAKPAYETMPIEDLHKLPVGALADDDCHIYMWITNRSLPKGFDLLEAWGFRYITCLTWCKPSFGMGNYFRGSTEHILFGVKGSQPLKRKNAGTWFQAKRGPGGHSSKPVEFYDLVESCSPGPFLEMFARSNRKDWTAWGAEA